MVTSDRRPLRGAGRPASWSGRTLAAVLCGTIAGLALTPGAALAQEMAEAAQAPSETPSDASAQGDNAFPVGVVTVRQTLQVNRHSLTGTIQALDSFSAGFRDGGRVISVLVDVGDVVRVGEQIAQIDPTQAQASLNSAQATLDAAEASLVQSRQAQTRASGLLERGSGTQADLDSATEAYLTAQASRDQAAAQLEAAQQTMEDTALTATEDAIVTERSAEPGQVVGAGQSIVTLASLEGREAVFYVPNLPELDEVMGIDARLTPLGGGDGVSMPVTEISPVVASNGTVTVKVAIEGDAARRFIIGEPVIGELTTESEPGISIPWTTFNATQEGPAVWVYDPETGQVHLQQITIGRYRSSTIEVASGLDDGDLIVTAGSHALYPGRHVVVKESAE
ncbi:efflux RND transporter periplasmic adaptor subunit [Pseudooceanicola algae]|uniref:Multidrug resistance protein MdtA n=1 Tax=Pseudooceanicola algae TaxID=1537215 RepID=A0A418SJX6_9RHOB|nr:efflux RND transporter periplasmic adaptor subunit [Pseudooceanicola algae]QPM88799.1 Multidrug resistance protein MdtA [Pseudooceanicola algae]